MPSKSPEQHNFMEAIKHSPEFAAKAGVPQSVGRDFAAADDAAGITKTHGKNMGGEIGSVPTVGTASSYPPPPGQRKQGPRNYGKKE